MDVYQACENRNLAVTAASRHCVKFSDTLKSQARSIGALNGCCLARLPVRGRWVPRLDGVREDRSPDSARQLYNIVIAAAQTAKPDGIAHATPQLGYARVGGRHQLQLISPCKGHARIRGHAISHASKLNATASRSKKVAAGIFTSSASAIRWPAYRQQGELFTQDEVFATTGRNSQIRAPAHPATAA